MIKSAINSFCTTTSCIIHTEISWTFLFKFISFSIASIYLRITFVQRWCFLNLLISVSKIFIIPDIVIIVSFNICCFLFWFFNLSPRRSAHPFLNQHISELFEYFIFFLEFFIFQFLILLICINIIWIWFILFGFLILLLLFVNFFPLINLIIAIICCLNFLLLKIVRIHYLEIFFL